MGENLDPINQVSAALSKHGLHNSIHVQQWQGIAGVGATTVTLIRNDDHRSAELPFITAMELLGREERWSVDELWSELEQRGFTEDPAANVRGLRNPGGSSIEPKPDEPSGDR